MGEPRVAMFGARIRKLRKERGWSQETLAAEAGIDRGYMGHIERGTLNVTIVKVFQIADALDLPPTALFEEDE